MFQKPAGAPGKAAKSSTDFSLWVSITQAKPPAQAKAAPTNKSQCRKKEENDSETRRRPRQGSKK